MLYVSDHGEPLREREIYLHGLPYALAPEAQTHVPAVLWFGSLDHVNVPQLRKHVHDYDTGAAHWIWDRHEVNG